MTPCIRFTTFIFSDTSNITVIFTLHNSGRAFPIHGQRGAN
jgi:hypothetical protein